MTMDGRIAALRGRVRENGLSIDEAAREQGVDPIVAHLWLRLPDDLLGSTTKAERKGRPRADEAGSVTAGGLRRVLLCRVVAAAIVQLRQGDGPLERAAEEALQRGLEQVDTRRPPSDGGSVRYAEGQRPLAVSLPLPAYAAVLDVAGRLFDSDPRAAAGWLIARGTGIAMAAPVAAAQRPTSTGRFPPPRRPRIAGGHRSAGPHGHEDDGTGTAAPSGDELRTMREALGLSQLEVAARTNLSRGTVAEVERGRRLNAATRRRIAETLAGLTRSA